MLTTTLLTAFLFAQGASPAPLVKLSGRGISVPKISFPEVHVQSLPMVEVAKMVRTTMSAEIENGKLSLGAQSLYAPGEASIDLDGNVVVWPLTDIIGLTAKVGNTEGSSMTIRFDDPYKNKTCVMILDGYDAGPIALLVETAAGSQTINVPKGEFHVPVAMTFADNAFVKVTPQFVLFGGGYIHLTSIQVYKVV